MSPAPTIQPTNPGTSKNLLQEETKANNEKTELTRNEFNEFLEDVADALNRKEGLDLPCIEASRKVCEHYNKHAMKAFDEVQYFLFQGVKVFEVGKREQAEARDKMSMEERVFGKPHASKVNA